MIKLTNKQASKQAYSVYVFIFGGDTVFLS